MMPPVRCFTCNATLPFCSFERNLRKGAPMCDAIVSCAVDRMCCRRMLICNQPCLESMMLKQNTSDVQDDVMGYTLSLRMRESRDVTSD